MITSNRDIRKIRTDYLAELRHINALEDRWSPMERTRLNDQYKAKYGEKLFRLIANDWPISDLARFAHDREKLIYALNRRKAIQQLGFAANLCTSKKYAQSIYELWCDMYKTFHWEGGMPEPILRMLKKFDLNLPPTVH